MAIPTITVGPTEAQTAATVPQVVSLSSVTSGRLLVVGVNWSVSGGTSITAVNITDEGSNTWTTNVMTEEDFGGGNFAGVALCTAPVTGTGSGTFDITVDFSHAGAPGTTGMTLVAYEVSGQHASLYMDDTSSGSGTSAAPDVITMTTTGDALVFGLIQCYGAGSSIAAGAGFSESIEDESTPSNAGSDYSIITGTVSGAGSSQPEWALGASRAYRAVSIALLGAAAAGGHPAGRRFAKRPIGNKYVSYF